VVKRVAAMTGNVNIGQAVVVVVGDRYAHAPAFAGESGGLRDVTELEAGVLVIERDHRITALPEVLNSRAIHCDDVEFAIVIAINQANPAAHGFDNVLLVGSGNVGHGKAGFTGDIFKTGSLGPGGRRKTEN
jgi:hypothetical protein